VINKNQSPKPSDPYSEAIKKLVKKTLIVMGICMILGAVGIVYVISKSGLKIFPTKQQPVALAVLPTPSPSASPSPTASTSTPTPSPSAESTNSPSPTPEPTSTPSLKPTTTPSLSSLDGFIDSTGVVNTSGEIRVGSVQKIVRGFFSFDISNNNAAEVSKAKIRLFQIGVKNNPFTNGNDIRVDFVNFGSSLDPSDYATASLNPSFSVVTTDNTAGWREIDVTSFFLQSKQSALSQLQFRLHSNFESEGSEAYVIFESGENRAKSNNIPVLVFELK